MAIERITMSIHKELTPAQKLEVTGNLLHPTPFVLYRWHNVAHHLEDIHGAHVIDDAGEVDFEVTEEAYRHYHAWVFRSEVLPGDNLDATDTSDQN